MTDFRATTGNPGTGDLSKQWEWHTAFRDASKNMYRTSYQDGINGREVAVSPLSFAFFLSKSLILEF